MANTLLLGCALNLQGIDFSYLMKIIKVQLLATLSYSPAHIAIIYNIFHKIKVSERSRYINWQIALASYDSVYGFPFSLSSFLFDVNDSGVRYLEKQTPGHIMPFL